MRSIAIVGMACRYPDARTPQQLWENVLAQRPAFRRIPPERLRTDDYQGPEDSIRCDIAGARASRTDNDFRYHTQRNTAGRSH